MADFAGKERAWAEARAQLQGEHGNLLAAIKAGKGTIPALVEAMQEVQVQLDALDRPQKRPRRHGSPSWRS